MDTGAPCGSAVVSKEGPQPRQGAFESRRQGAPGDQPFRRQREENSPAEVDKENERGKWQAGQQREQKSDKNHAAERIERLEINELVDRHTDIAQHEPGKTEGREQKE